jgi:hypothetical protein
VSAVSLDKFRERARQVQIVPFTRNYLESALEVAREVRAQSVYAHLPVNWDKVAAQLMAAGTDECPDRYFRLAVRGDRVLGGLYGCVQRVFFADFLMAKDLGWWVRSEARGSIAALALLLGLGQTGVYDLEKTGRLFKHAGYDFVGYNAQKDL